MTFVLTASSVIQGPYRHDYIKDESIWKFQISGVAGEFNLIDDRGRAFTDRHVKNVSLYIFGQGSIPAKIQLSKFLQYN